MRAVELTLNLQERVAGSKAFAPRVRPVHAVINGDRLNVRAPVVHVKPSSRIVGLMEVEYTTVWPTGSVWLSMTPTWGNPRTSGRELFPLITPVQRELVEVPVDEVAPVTPGRYWLLYLVAAEPSGMFALSRTNWAVVQPEWNDGYEIAGTSDSTIRLANTAGFVNLPVVFPHDWPASGRNCVAASSGRDAHLRKMCDNLVTMFGIEVIVE